MSGESRTVNQQVDESAKSVEKLPINTLQKKVRFVNIGNLEDKSKKLKFFQNKQITKATSPTETVTSVKN